MMSHLTSMKITWDNVLFADISFFYGQRILDGVVNHLAER